MNVMDNRAVDPFGDEVRKQRAWATIGHRAVAAFTADGVSRGAIWDYGWRSGVKTTELGHFRYLMTDIGVRVGSVESGKTTVAEAASEALPAGQRRKASPKVVALLERFKNVPSVDPHLLREDIDRVLDPNLQVGMVAGREAQDEPGILDTSVVISLPDITDPALLPEDPRISIVTIAELNVGPKVTDDEEVREARARQLEATEDAFDPLPLDNAVARAFGDVAASLHSRKAKKKARSIDALIAATAVANDMTLYTSNPDDFAGIEGLNIFEVPEPTRLIGWRD